VSASTLTYAELPPPQELRSVVAAFWQIRGSAAVPVCHVVLPDGCMDLICDVARPGHTGTSDGEWRCIGTATRAQPVVLAGAVDIFGIRFRPGAIAALCGVDAASLTDGDAAMRDVIDLSLGAAEQLAAVRDIEARCRQVAPALCERTLDLARDWRTIEFILGGLRQGDRRVPVDAIAHSVGVGRRQLERRILRTVGIGPTRFRSICRLRRLLTLASAAPRRPWSQIALDAGYADQSHMSREFLRYAGSTPERWRSRNEDVAIVQDGRIAVD
jgi:AraC-like DNA-binding protein